MSVNLPDGVYERRADGTLFPTNKVMTNDPPVLIKPLSMNTKGEIVNVTRQGVDYMRQAAEEHYEMRARLLGAETMVSRVRINELADRAAESVMGSH